MKLSRDDLKVLVKECLLELLSEGLGAVTPLRHAQAPTRAVEGRRRGENVMLSPSRPTRSGGPSDALREAIKRESGGDPLLAGILSDTAQNTLPRMMEGDRARGSGAAVRDFKTPVPVAAAR